MLVKQWLREFFSGQWTSPKVLLRVHFYRYPGLIGWFVFELAALLPVILLVSLGFFLLGLCFFTASVDTGVGKSTTVTVTLWAALFILAVLSPLVSPRCPFKITFLKRTMAICRHALADMSPRIKRYYRRHSNPLVSRSYLPPGGFGEKVLQEEGFGEEEEHFEEEAFARHRYGWDLDLNIMMELDREQLDDQLFMDTIIPLVKSMDIALQPSTPAAIINTLVVFLCHRDPHPVIICEDLENGRRPNLKASYVALEGWIDLARVLSVIITTLPFPTSPASGVLQMDIVEIAILLLLSETKYQLPREGLEAMAGVFRRDVTRSVSLMWKFSSSSTVQPWVSAESKFDKLVNQDIRGVLSLLEGKVLENAILELIKSTHGSESIRDFLARPSTVNLGSQQAKPTDVVFDLLIGDIDKKFATRDFESASWIQGRCLVLMKSAQWKSREEIMTKWAERSSSFDWCLLLALSTNDDTVRSLFLSAIRKAPQKVIGKYWFLDLLAFF